jgi:High potential iron-sulfur protein
MKPPLSRPPLSRRLFVQTLALGAATTVLKARSAHAEPQKLDVNDPAAVALGYIEDATRVDAKKYPTYVKGNNCDNCLQLQGNAGEKYRPCTIFAGKLVADGGWCSSWTAEI